MHHTVWPELVEDPAHGIGVGDRALDDREPFPFTQIVATPGRVVIDREDLVALSQQPIGEVRADKPAPSRYQNPHSVVLSQSRGACSGALGRGMSAARS